MKKKIIIVFIIIILIAASWIFHLDEYFSLSYLKESRNNFELMYSEHRIAVITGYMAAYIIITAVFLPGSTVMGLAAGAFFGLSTGTVAASFASSIGATLACCVSRFILRDWIQSKFSEKLKTVNEGIAKEGKFYLFTLRVIPIFPFLLINFVMGLTKMPLKTYYWVSQIGMLPATFILVNAGHELGKIDSLWGVFSPGLVLSLALLGVFPMIAHRLMVLYRSKKGNDYEKAVR